MDTRRIPPDGDPFYAAAHEEGRACLCLDGFHYMGHEVELPDGEVEIEYSAVPCRRCNEAGVV